jgi:opacity protein-like surface antigen
MIRIVRVAPIVFAVVVCGFSTAFAQAAGAAASRGYAEFDIAATLGHKSDKAIGGEVGFHLRPKIDVFAEGGHIGNAASADLEAGATLIANNVGAAANAISKVNYFDVGVRYGFEAAPNVHPYVAFGIGAAQVKNETTFAVNGTVVPEESIGIQSGTDLNGSETKAFLMIGGGATITLKPRYFLDVSYRFGGVISAPSPASANGALLKTSRVQLGIGLTF